MIYSAYQDTDMGLCGVSVVSSGRIFARKGRSINRPCGRDNFLLFYVAKGSEHIFFDSEKIMTEGSFVIFRPSERQEHIQMEEGVSKFYYVHFNALPEFDLFGFESSVVYRAKPSARITDLFEEIIDELLTKQTAYEKVCVSKLFNIFSLLERNCADEKSVCNRYADRISFIIRKMNTEYEKDYSLEEFAAMCNMSKFHFVRIFKSITGTSPIEYRNEIRLEHAKELLADTEIPVDEIARSVGYASGAYFCGAFKRQTGISPAKYRKEKR